MTTPLPTNIDATYADSASDPSVAAHQQQHDALHGRYNTVIAGDPVTIVSPTASYTLVLTDAGRLVRQTTAAASTLTVPADASVAFPVGTAVEVEQAGAGQVTVTPATGVTLLSPAGLKTRAQYSAASLVKVAANTWRVAGDTTT